jgi:hypothetical protein
LVDCGQKQGDSGKNCDHTTKDAQRTAIESEFFIKGIGAVHGQCGPAETALDWSQRHSVFRFLILAVATCCALFAANLKLYMKDGTFEVAREYKVEGDRVKFYSIERSDWEEIPVEMVDLKKTESAIQARQEAVDKLSKEVAEEDDARREMERTIRKIPQDPGVYRIENDQVRIFKNAESTVHTDKGRSVLKALSPIPLVPGKATVEIQGEHSLNPVTDDRPEFYLQLNQEEQFGIIKLTPGKGIRVVEKLTIIAVAKETVEERQTVEVFTRQMPGNGLYRIWPQASLEKGEYAVVQFTEGQLNMQIWDFSIR